MALCIVGVHNTEYEVQLSPDGEKRAKKLSYDDNETPVDRLAKAVSINNVNRHSSSAGSDESELSSTRKLDVFRVVGPDAYFMGIIDYQQKWTMKKKVGEITKILLMCVIVRF